MENCGTRHALALETVELSPPPPMNRSGLHPVPRWEIPAAGDFVGGIYEVVREIGSGAMGVVLLAVDKQLGRKVAIKIIHSRLYSSDFRERFFA